MPLALAERLYAQLAASAPVAWTETRGTVLPFRYRHLTGRHISACACAVCTSLAALRSPRVCAEIANAMGFGRLMPTELGVTWFDRDDFLDPHTDCSAGRDVAFVWNLAKDWTRELGGCLCMMSTANGSEHVEVPVFNRMLVFDVREDRSPHYVSRVRVADHRRRFAISGWYRQA